MRDDICLDTACKSELDRRAGAAPNIVQRITQRISIAGNNRTRPSQRKTKVAVVDSYRYEGEPDAEAAAALRKEDSEKSAD